MSLFRNESPVLSRDAMIAGKPGVSGDPSTGSANLYRIPAENAVALNGIVAATPTTQAVFVANDYLQLVDVRASFDHAGGAAAAAQIEKLTGTTAPGSGTNMLNAAVDLTAAANTVQSPALVSTVATLQLSPGDRIGLHLSGTLTGLTGGAITLYFARWQ